MAKKKNERLAKEKEEKSKKANEVAALKRKTEVNKQFSNRMNAAVKSDSVFVTFSRVYAVFYFLVFDRRLRRCLQ